MKATYMQVVPAGPLHGSVQIPGSKNSSLGLLAAACLADSVVHLEGIPLNNDIRIIAQIAKDIGMSMIIQQDGTITLDPRYIHSSDIEPSKASSYRASYYFVGALLAKCGTVTIGAPGGDDFGSRPIDQHIKALQALGATFSFHQDYYVVEAARLTGADIYFDTITSGATINAMLAAVRAHGRTDLRNAAKDPEVVDVAHFLGVLGAKITGAGTDHIRIEGVPYLGGGRYTVIPDRLLAGACLMAAGITCGQVTVTDVIPEHLGSCVAKLTEIGLHIESTDSSMTAYGAEKLRATRVRTGMYPGFATDLQQPITTLLALANGKSIITDKIFPKRFSHIPQLRRMGVEAEIRGESAWIRGGKPLIGTRVHATDVRAGTCLLLAGLIAEGKTIITGVEHIERGYENAVGMFTSLGASVSIHSGDWSDHVQLPDRSAR